MQPQQPANQPAAPTGSANAAPIETFVRLTKHPESNQWENAEWMVNAFGPGRPGVRFNDGKIFDVEASKIDHAGVNTGAPAITNEPQSVSAPIAPQLSKDYDMFKQVLVKLDSQSKVLFDLPLDVLLTMIHRFATQQGLGGSGKMGVYAGMAQFVPDEKTFDEWAAAYLIEIQRRESAGTVAEA